MRDPFSWSFGLGRWGDCRVRVHIFFLAFCAATFYLWWPATGTRAAAELLQGVSAGLALLFASVLLHELSHWLVARRHGIKTDAIVIGPLGGLSPWPHTDNARAELAFFAAGPASNLLVCIFCAIVLVGRDPDVAIKTLFNPLQPAWTVGGPVLEQAMMVTLWINWLLLLINILPAFPFDGGRLLQAILGIARPDWTRKQVGEFVFWLAVVVALGILAVALVLWKHAADAPYPTWFPLVLLAVVLLVGARRDLEAAYASALSVTADVVDDQDSRELPAPMEAADLDAPPGPDESWDLPSEEVTSDASPEEMEAFEERQLDAVLTQLHAHGIESLSTEDRQLLERVSARLRSRMGRRR